MMTLQHEIQGNLGDAFEVTEKNFSKNKIKIIGKNGLEQEKSDESIKKNIIRLDNLACWHKITL